jgi:hypothetical protein
MFISKKQLSRRAVLRGMGASLALPFLDAMAPAQTMLASPRSRLACIEMVHGAAGSTDEGASKHHWSPRNEGPVSQFSYSLEPLAALREYITIVSGTDARQADAFAPSEGGADHFRSSAVFLTAAHAKQTTGLDICNGVSIDQMYAQRMDTRLPSIRSCGFDYSCIYSETISWVSPTKPLPMEVNPRVAFEKLFRAAAAGSILDGIAEDQVGLKTISGRGIAGGWTRILKKCAASRGAFRLSRKKTLSRR